MRTLGSRRADAPSLGGLAARTAPSVQGHAAALVLLLTHLWRRHVPNLSSTELAGSPGLRFLRAAAARGVDFPGAPECGSHDRPLPRRSNAGVDLRRVDRGVAQEVLHDAQVGALFHQV